MLSMKTTNEYILGEFIKRAEAVGVNASVAAAYSISSQDFLGLDNLVSRLRQSNPEMSYIAVVDTDSKVLAHSDITKRDQVLPIARGPIYRREADGTIIREVSGPGGKNSFFEVNVPITFLDRKLGWIILGISRAIPAAAQERAKGSLVSVLLIALLFGTAGVALLSYSVTKPIKELEAGVLDMKEGKRARPLHIYSSDELGRLTRSFNEMASLIDEQKARLGKYAGELEDAYVSTLRVLAAAIDARDPYTMNHSARVASLSVNLGQAIGLGKKELEELEIACLFHDVGKIKTPDYVLLKEGRLDAEESREMRRHTEEGADIIGRGPSLKKYIPVVRHHHEWFNGKGYPDGLKGDQIPLFASIVSIADSFDAMTSTRPYRKARSEEAALKELIDCSGTQFNPRLVEVFMKVYKNNNESFMAPGVI
jgi:putative nucleotidyltransferase with HDIG domain